MSLRRAMRNARKRTEPVKFERISTGTFTVTLPPGSIERLKHLRCHEWSPLLQEFARAPR